jgi:hypothetical protein
MIRRLILAATLVLPTTGCTAGIYTGFEELHPAAAPVHAERIAVLPVTAAAGSESYRGVIGDSLLAVAQRAHPSVEFISPAEALDRLNDAGLAERFANLLVGYQQTGIFDRTLLRQVGGALGADHALQLRVGYERTSEVQNRLFYPSEMYESERQDMHVTVLLWDVREGGLAWEASGGGSTQEGEYTIARQFEEVLAATAGQLAQQLPLARADSALAGQAAGGR